MCMKSYRLDNDVYCWQEKLCVLSLSSPLTLNISHLVVPNWNQENRIINVVCWFSFSVSYFLVLWVFFLGLDELHKTGILRGEEARETTQLLLPIVTVSLEPLSSSSRLFNLMAVCQLSHYLSWLFLVNVVQSMTEYIQNLHNKYCTVFICNV